MRLPPSRSHAGAAAAALIALLMPTAGAASQVDDAAVHTVSAIPCLNLRAEPSPAAPILYCLADGVTVQITERRAGWLRVRSTGGTEGWVADGFLRGSGRSAPAAEIDGLEREIARLRTALDEATERVEALAERNARLEAEAARPDAGCAARDTLAEEPLKPLEPVAAPPDDPAAAVRRRVASWAAAASAGDAAAFLEHYAATFRAEGRLPSPLEEASPAPGEELRIELTSADRALASFHYRAAPDEAPRIVTLEWVREAGRWLIQRETERPAAP